MIEEKEYAVTLTIKTSTIVYFAPIERDRPITKSDAIENAIGGFMDYPHPDSLGRFLESNGFDIALPIEGEAIELDD